MANEAGGSEFLPGIWRGDVKMALAVSSNVRSPLTEKSSLFQLCLDPSWLMPYTTQRLSAAIVGIAARLNITAASDL